MFIGTGFIHTGIYTGKSGNSAFVSKTGNITNLSHELGTK